MNAGDLRNPITLLLDPVTETDARGNNHVSWQRQVKVYASMADVSGRDFYEAKAHHSLDVVTFGIRWRDDITDECAILHHGTTYKIDHINRLGMRRDFMKIKARAVEGKG
ncbi:phage head closure protein [Eubacteriales bacterium OttesenSCG-928-A19]|nr:phage head closure protein [Eubacteriales bacterium OttesenSCG-928-A19]